MYLLVHHKSTINVSFSIFNLFKSNWFMALLKMVIFHSYVNVYQYPLAIHSGKSTISSRAKRPRRDCRRTVGPGAPQGTLLQGKGKPWENAGKCVGKCVGKWWENDGKMMILSKTCGWKMTNSWSLAWKASTWGIRNVRRNPMAGIVGKSKRQPDQLDAWKWQGKHHL